MPTYMGQFAYTREALAGMVPGHLKDMKTTVLRLLYQEEPHP